ncbi:MAG: glycosyltransferase [Spirochaetales bacterium]|nr:MAG: glycosyltransferase [Spirochaetales bacterium]
MADGFRVGIVSGKLGAVDGVSLETDKWISVLAGLGHEVFTIAGRYATELQGVPSDRQLTLGTIRFDSEEQRKYEQLVFPHLSRRPPQLSNEKRQQIVQEMEEQGADVAHTLYEMVRDNEIDVLIAENTNAMPMTLLGGIAVHQVATEMRVATIFHHHDFWWERSRFSNNRIRGLLNRIMPPVDLGLEHAVISSYAAHILSSLKRVSPFVIPNCEDFEHPVERDDYNGSFREDLGFDDNDILVVQPTRVVPRKRIEDSLRLLRRFLDHYPAYRGRLHYIISLYQGDEPNENYIERIRDLAEDAGIPFHMISDRVASTRGLDDGGRRIYTNRDVLVNADLVTYLPIWEGFGNALLEAIAARVPVVTTTYLVYKTDIKVTGLRNIEIRDAYDEQGHLVIPDAILEAIERVLTHPEERAEMTEQNFAIAKREFGLGVLESKIAALFSVYGDEIRASRQRLAKSKLHYSV